MGAKVGAALGPRRGSKAIKYQLERDCRVKADFEQHGSSARVLTACCSIQRRGE
jgi:hypothetical protein